MIAGQEALTMTETPLVLPFPDPRCRDVALSGGKGASLETMTC